MIDNYTMPDVSFYATSSLTREKNFI